MCSCHCLQGQVVWCASGRMLITNFYLLKHLSVPWQDQSPRCYGLQSTCKLIQIHETSEVASCTSPVVIGGYAWVAVGVLVAGHTKGSCAVSCLSDQKGLNAFQSNDTEVNVSDFMSSWQCCTFSYCPCLNDSSWHATSVLQLPRLLQLG